MRSDRTIPPYLQVVHNGARFTPQRMDDSKIWQQSLVEARKAPRDCLKALQDLNLTHIHLLSVKKPPWVTLATKPKYLTSEEIGLLSPADFQTWKSAPKHWVYRQPWSKLLHEHLEYFFTDPIRFPKPLVATTNAQSADMPETFWMLQAQMTDLGQAVLKVLGREANGKGTPT